MKHGRFPFSLLPFILNSVFKDLFNFVFKHTTLQLHSYDFCSVLLLRLGVGVLG
jgi:hypothetical protein